MALPLAEGASFTVNLFDAGTGRVDPVTFAVADAGDVTVAAGTFAAYRVDVQVRGQPLTYYVTRATPRRVVKVELAGQPVTFELVNR